MGQTVQDVSVIARGRTVKVYASIDDITKQRQLSAARSLKGGFMRAQSGGEDGPKEITNLQEKKYFAVLCMKNWE